MKVAVSIPDDVFAEADRYAKRTGSTRSAIYGQALTEFLRDRSASLVTDAINAAVDSIGEDKDNDSLFIAKAGRKTFVRSEW